MSQEETPKNLNKFQSFFYNYGRYHYNLLNIVIHIICVPIITITLDKMVDLSTKGFGLSFNPFLILYAILTPIYIYVDFISGVITSLQYPILGYFLGKTQFSILGLSELQSISLLHIIAWIMQFIGHGVFEKRKPALLDNIFLVFNAPVFVNIELMNFIFKYREEELNETRKYIREDISKYRKAKGLQKLE